MLNQSSYIYVKDFLIFLCGYSSCVQMYRCILWDSSWSYIDVLYYVFCWLVGKWLFFLLVFLVFGSVLCLVLESCESNACCLLKFCHLCIPLHYWWRTSHFYVLQVSNGYQLCLKRNFSLIFLLSLSYFFCKFIYFLPLMISDINRIYILLIQWSSLLSDGPN